MRFPCPACHQGLSAPDSAAGKAVACPHCGQKAAVPDTVTLEEDVGWQWTGPRVVWLLYAILLAGLALVTASLSLMAERGSGMPLWPLFTAFVGFALCHALDRLLS